MAESVIYNDGHVSVSSTRFIVGQQTYAMQSVTSVKSARKPRDLAPALLIGLIGLLCLFGSGKVLIFGIVMVIISILAFIGSKAEYSVVLNTSSGESQALVSKDEIYIGEVISALNNAIVSRG